MNKIEEVKVSKRQQTISAEDKKCLIPIFVSTNYDKFLLMDSNRLLKAGKIARLKEAVSRLQATKKVVLDESLATKSKEIFQVLDSFKTQKISDHMIKTILRVQALAEEA